MPYEFGDSVLSTASRVRKQAGGDCQEYEQGCVKGLDALILDEETEHEADDDERELKLRYTLLLRFNYLASQALVWDGSGIG